jgi:hypothetical protein
VDGLLEPGGSLAGRCCECDKREWGPRKSRLLCEQGDDLRDGRRLAGARSTGDDGKRTQNRGSCGQTLAVVGLTGEQSLERFTEDISVLNRSQACAASQTH